MRCLEHAGSLATGSTVPATLGDAKTWQKWDCTLTNLSNDAANRPNNSFNLLRLLAAYGVLFSHHFGLVGDREPQVPGFGSLGVFSLTVFFVISGYFIASSWARTPDPLVFWRKRVLRIFPALVAVVVLSILVIGPMETDLSVQDYATNALTWSYWQNAVLVLGIQQYLPGVFTLNTISAVNVPLWSLPVELFMYAMVFLVGVTVLRVTRWAYPSLAVVFAIAWFLAPGVEFGVLLQTFNLGVFFFLGATAFSFGILERLKPTILLASAVFILFAVVMGGSNTKPILWVTVPLLVLGLGSMPTRPGTIVANFGDISYGVYLWAYPIQQIMIGRLFGSAGFWPTMLMSIVVTTVLALVSWIWIERPALALKNRKGASDQPANAASGLPRKS